jgi:hypothetical protein
MHFIVWPVYLQSGKDRVSSMENDQIIGIIASFVTIVTGMAAAIRFFLNNKVWKEWRVIIGVIAAIVMALVAAFFFSRSSRSVLVSALSPISTSTLAVSSILPPTITVGPGTPTPTPYPNQQGGIMTATPKPPATPTLPPSAPTPTSTSTSGLGHIAFSVPPWGAATNCASGQWQTFSATNTGTKSVVFHGHSDEFNAEITPTDGTIAPGGHATFEMNGTAASGKTNVLIEFSFTGNDTTVLQLYEPCTGN